MVLAAMTATVIVLASCATTKNAQAAEKAKVAAASAVGRLEGKQASSSASANTSSSGPPAWVSEYPTDPKYFVGVGSAPDTGHPSADIAAAQKAARNALAQEISTKIHSDTTMNTSQNGKGPAEQSASVSINEQVNLTLDGVQLVASYHTKKLGYWYYYRLPRDALDPASAISVGVAGLTTAIKSPSTVSFGSLTYSDSGMSSAFSAYLHDQILTALEGDKDITISSQPVRAPVSAKTGTKKGEAKRGPKVKASVVSGMVLSGTFFGGSKGKVSVFLRLTDPAKKEVVGASSFALDSSLLPSGIEVRPVNYATAVAAKDAVAPVGKSGSSGLRIQLWTDRGQSPVYRDGQDLVLDFSTNRDCYIKMYHIDVYGKVSLILPNQYSQGNFFQAGRVYRIPPEGATYRFQLGAPYGVESIKVIASTRQFSTLEPAFTDLGQATRGLLTRGLEVTGTGPEETAQAMVSYTILARNNTGS